GLARARAEDDAETVEIVARCTGMHHLDGATGEAEGHRPHRPVARPVDDLVVGRREKAPFSSLDQCAGCECEPPGSDMPATVRPVAFTFSCSARSPIDTMPTSRLLRSTTGSLRTLTSLMLLATSSSSASSKQYRTSVDITSRMRVSGLLPWA